MPAKVINGLPANTNLPGLSTPKHPLCYPNFLESQRAHADPQHITPTMNGSSTTASKSSLLANPQNAEQRLLSMYERQRIIDLCNAYAYTLDCTMADPTVADDWANLFTEDCQATYPFGTHFGRAGLAEFGMAAEGRFQRMLHSNTNFTVVFETDDVAHARYTCFALSSARATDLADHFKEGGYYYTTFKRLRNGDTDVWKIASLTLDVSWIEGDSLGLNEVVTPVVK